MKSKWVLVIALVALVSLMIAPVNAAPTYTFNNDSTISAIDDISFTSTSSTGITVAAGSQNYRELFLDTPDIGLHLTINLNQGAKGLSRVEISDQELYFHPSRTPSNSNLKIYHIPINITSPNETLVYGNGILHLLPLGNFSGTSPMGTDAGLFDIILDIGTFSPAGSTGSIEYKLNNITPIISICSMYGSYAHNYGVPGTALAVFGLKTDVGGTNHILIGRNSTIQTTRLTYKFRHNLTGTFDANNYNLTTLQITKEGFGSDVSSTSNLSLKNGRLHPLLTYNVGDKNLYFETYYPPFYLSFNDTVTGLGYNETWFPDNFITPGSSTFGFSVSPESGTIASTFTAMASGDFSGLNAYTIICTSGQVSGTCLSNNTGSNFLKKSDDYWYQIGDDGSSIQLSTSFPSTVPLAFSNAGQYVVSGTFFPTDPALDGISISDNVTVISQGSTKKLTVSVKDSSTNSFVSGAMVKIINSFGNWSNQTTASGIRIYIGKEGEIIGYGATATGYHNSSIVYSYLTDDLQKTVLLNPIIAVGEGNNTLYVYVKDKGTLAGLDGALVYLSDGQTRTTPGSGMATFTVLEGATYKITVTKTGYQPLTGSITVAGTGNAISMELSRLTVTTSPTLAPGASPTVDIRTDTQKDADMMGKVRDSGDELIGIAIVAAMFGLIGLIGKSMK